MAEDEVVDTESRQIVLNISNYAISMKKKGQEFERWVGQKEKAIEAECQKRVKIESDLEEAQVEIAELKKQLEQKDSKISSLEEVVVDEHHRYSEVIREKKEVEEKLATQEIFGKELCDFQGYIEKMKSEAREVKVQLAAKTDECSELQEINDKAKTDLEKQTAKLNKQLESLKAKLDKTTEEKKEKVAHIKEITKLHKRKNCKNWSSNCRLL